MKWLWFLLAGLLGGVLAGMGMGGGTLTIPLLVLALGVDQLTAQFANLTAFLPTGAASLVVHVKNGLIDTKGLAAFIIPAGVSAMRGVGFPKRGSLVVPLMEKAPRQLMSYISANSCP